MKRKRTAALIALLAGLSGPTFSGAEVMTLAQSHSLPVMIGGEAGLDACGTYGHVVGLDPDGSSRLNLRFGPGVQFDVRARLKLGTPLWICDQVEDWIAVIYPQNGPNQDCGVSSPAQQSPTAYQGPCTPGWVHNDYIEALAG